MAHIILSLKKASDALTFIKELSVKDLETVITYAADVYYNTEESVITDALYDTMIDYLRLLNPKSKVLTNVGAPIKSKEKVKLDYWLGSMDKIKPDNEKQLASWLEKYKGPYNLSDKMDGVSALLVYKKDGSIKMFTRGTATEGQDISILAKYLELPEWSIISAYCSKHKIVSENKDNLIAFRGELVIKKKTFEKNWSSTLKNARNSVAGLVNSKTINPNLANDTNLVIYEVVDPFYVFSKQLEIIEDLKFETVFNNVVKKELTFEYLSTYLKNRRTKSLWDIDGIIVTDMTNNKRNIKGNPEYAWAFKDVLEDQMAKTTVIEVVWKISKDGFINPTLIVEPIQVGGVTINRAPAHNAKFIVDNKLGPGAEILLIRSGDVIPYVKKVIKGTKPSLPPATPKWTWNTTNVDIKLVNPDDSPEVAVKSIHYFFSSLDTKGLGEKNVEKIYEAGLTDVESILSATKDDFLEVEGFKDKSASNLVTAIKKAVNNIPLARFMSASNKLGAGLGEERFKQVLALYPNLLVDANKWSLEQFVEKIKQVNGWEEKTSTLMANNWSDFMDFYNSIKKYITLELPKEKKIIKGNFTDKIVVFTGFRDKELEEKIEAQGGKVSSAVSKNTNYLVVKDKETLEKGSEKITKAEKVGTKVITKDQLIKML